MKQYTQSQGTCRLAQEEGIFFRQRLACNNNSHKKRHFFNPLLGAFSHNANECHKMRNTQQVDQTHVQKKNVRADRKARKRRWKYEMKKNLGSTIVFVVEKINIYQQTDIPSKSGVKVKHGIIGQTMAGFL